MKASRYQQAQVNRAADMVARRLAFAQSLAEDVELRHELQRACGIVEHDDAPSQAQLQSFALAGIEVTNGTEVAIS